MYAVEINDLEKLLESAVKLTVHETVAELRKSGLLSTPDKMAYKVAAQKIQSHFDAISAGGQGDKQIAEAIKEIKDEYQGILKYYFSDHMTIEKIAEIYDCDPCTITRNKKRLCLEVYKRTLQK